MTKKLRIIWEEKNLSALYIVPDLMVEKKVENNIRDFQMGEADYNVVVGAEIILLGFRLAVKEKKISHKDIVFVFNDIEVNVDKDGRYLGYVNFASVLDNLLSRIM